MARTGNDLKGRAAMSSKKPMPGYIWLLAGLAIGLFVSFLVYLQKQPAKDINFTQAIKQELNKVKQSRAETAAQNKDGADQSSEPPRFDFYTILPELEVFIPESEINGGDKSNTTSSSPQSRPQSNGKQYLLQAGSFRSNTDADRLKATLALLGVQSSIQTVSIKNDTWHRVRIGPFSDPQQLHQTLNTLKNNKIHAMTMELKN